MTILALIASGVQMIVAVVGVDKGLGRDVVLFGPLLIEFLWIIVVGVMLWPRYSLLVRGFRSN